MVQVIVTDLTQALFDLNDSDVLIAAPSCSLLAATHDEKYQGMYSKKLQRILLYIL